MDLAPMLLICTPIFLPIVVQFGIDPVHFGIIMILNLGIGLLTPPVGPTLAVGCAIGKVSMETLSRAILPFYVPMLFVLILVTYIPAPSCSGCRACSGSEPMGQCQPGPSGLRADDQGTGSRTAREAGSGVGSQARWPAPLELAYSRPCRPDPG